jgi:hypothetical protein
MTTEQTNSEETPKKKRLPVALKKRIAELEGQYAIAVTNGDGLTKDALRAKISRLENGEPEEEFRVAEGDGIEKDVGEDIVLGPGETRSAVVEGDGSGLALPDVEGDGSGLALPDVEPIAADANPISTPKPSWAADVLAAKATAEPEWTWEVSEEVIDVPLTDADRANMLRANGADEETKATVDREIDEAKATLKEKKAESETIAARMKDRNRSGSKETAPKKAHWKVGTCFALNTLVYVDPDTGVEVSRRPLTQRERQLELGVDKALDLIKPKSDDGQLSLGDVEPTDLTNPEALLLAAQQGEQDPADAPLDNEPSSSDLGDDDDSDDEEGSDS